jgi:putative flippase GtrA
MGVDQLLDDVGRRWPLLAKLVKYSAASAAAVTAYVVILVVCREALGQGEMASHLVAVCLSSIPNYLINRSWTWQQTGKNRLWGEIIPFWFMSILGAILSIIFVAYVQERSDQTWAIVAANLSAFGVLWMAKFLVLDKVMWRVVHELHPELDLEPARQ